MKLDIGCGTKKVAGSIGIDRLRVEGVDVVAELDGGFLPFREDTFTEVTCFHVLEHVRNLVALIEEIHRVCASGARVSVKVPAMFSKEAVTDPTHVRQFTSRSLAYFTLGAPEQSLRYSPATFQLKRTSYKRAGSKTVMSRVDALMQRFANRFTPTYESRLASWYPMSELSLELEVVK